MQTYLFGFQTEKRVEGERSRTISLLPESPGPENPRLKTGKALLRIKPKGPPFSFFVGIGCGLQVLQIWLVRSITIVQLEKNQGKSDIVCK